MSAQAGGGVPASRPSLYDYALRLHQSQPDGRLPRGGYPLPDQPEQAPPKLERLGWRKARAAIRDAVAPLLSDPDTARAAEEVCRRLGELGVADRAVPQALSDLAFDDVPTARALGRRLTRTGTTKVTVIAGIAILGRLGEAEDVACLKILGLLEGLALPVVDALGRLDDATAALVWLADRASHPALRHLIDAIAAGDDDEARGWLLRAPLGPGTVGPSMARRIAEAVRLSDVLGAEPVDPLVVAQAGRLLSGMTGLRDYEPEILNYRQATATYASVVAHAAQLPATVDHYAILLSLALDLHSGPSVLLDWAPGQREALLDTLGAVLNTPVWAAVQEQDPEDQAERRRVQWIRRAARQPFAPPTASRLRIEPTVRDPAHRDTVETRVLLDGRPLVPEAFAMGAANCPEYLLDKGLLRATADPREVQLAEAWCTEGCCGALHVTICREGDQVVWRDWRRPTSRRSRPELPEYRFDAAEYDAEIARAENDRSWAWPARNTARLIAAGVREQPDLLTRWDCQAGWISTDFDEPDSAVISFLYWPGLAAGERDPNGPWLQFMWRIPDDGTPDAGCGGAPTAGRAGPEDLRGGPRREPG